MKTLLRSSSIVAALCFLASPAFPCSCADPSVREKFRTAHAVFVGKIINISLVEPTDDFPLAMNRVQFQVERWYKGAKKSEITVIADYDQPGWCGDLPLTIGERYVIYAGHKKGRLTMYEDCGPNRRMGEAAGEVKRLDGFWFRAIARLYPYPAL